MDKYIIKLAAEYETSWDELNEIADEKLVEGRKGSSYSWDEPYYKEPGYREVTVYATLKYTIYSTTDNRLVAFYTLENEDLSLGGAIAIDKDGNFYIARESDNFEDIVYIEQKLEEAAKTYLGLGG